MQPNTSVTLSRRVEVICVETAKKQIPMIDLHLIFDGPLDEAPNLEIEPKGHDVSLGRWKQRDDGKCEIVLRFAPPIIREIELDQAET